jgi:hypothetical protein
MTIDMNLTVNRPSAFRRRPEAGASHLLPSHVPRRHGTAIQVPVETSKLETSKLGNVETASLSPFGGRACTKYKMSYKLCCIQVLFEL